MLRRSTIRIITAALCLGPLGRIFPPAFADESLRVMSFNIWVGGEAGQQPLSQTAKVIQVAEADIVGVQESHGERRDGKRPDAALSIARTLGWHFFDQGDEDTGILSRHKITGHTPKNWGVRIELPSGRHA